MPPLATRLVRAPCLLAYGPFDLGRELRHPLLQDGIAAVTVAIVIIAIAAAAAAAAAAAGRAQRESDRFHQHQILQLRLPAPGVVKARVNSNAVGGFIHVWRGVHRRRRRSRSQEGLLPLLLLRLVPSPLVIDLGAPRNRWRQAGTRVKAGGWGSLWRRGGPGGRDALIAARRLIRLDVHTLSRKPLAIFALLSHLRLYLQLNDALLLTLHLVSLSHRERTAKLNLVASGLAEGAARVLVAPRANLQVTLSADRLLAAARAVESSAIILQAQPAR